MEVISYRQSVFLLSMILPVTGHMLLLPTIFSLSGRDAWAAILFSLPIGFLLGFIIFRLQRLHPTKTMVEMLEHAFGRVLGKGITTGLLVYFLYMLIITLYGLMDFIQVIFLTETPSWVIVAAFYLVVLYGVVLGIESIARMSEPLLLIIMITGGLIGIATIPDKNFELLLPLFENGTMPVVKGMIVTTALFGEFIILTMLKLRKDHAHSKSLLFTNTMLVILITVMFLGTVTSTLSIFGEEQVKSLEYPAQSVVRLISIGFIERYDVYGIAVMVFGCVIRMATFQWIFNLAIRQWLGLSRKWLIHGIILAVVIVIVFMGIENHQQYVDVFITTYYPLTAVISVGVPFLAWIMLEWREKRSW